MTQRQGMEYFNDIILILIDTKSLRRQRHMMFMTISPFRNSS